MKKEALLYKKLDNNQVHCFLCAHQCHIPKSKFGFCGVRQNLEGILYTYTYGSVITAHIDPIEKKPLYHFLPGSVSFSIATIGCNFRCGFCQNWEISQQTFQSGDGKQDLSLQGTVPKNEEFSPGEIVNSALKNNCQSISYTYTEPTIFFEYALDIVKLAKKEGLKNIFVTNGFMSKECLDMISPYLDAANIDLKFFNDESYKRVCAGSLAPVLDSIRLMKDKGVWVEVTTLVVTGENDSEEELSGIAEFIASVDKNMPWHISKFHPDYKFTGYRATAETTLKKAEELGRQAGLKYVYVGNVYGWGNDTYCHSCKKLLIRREVFNILENNIKSGKCRYCNIDIPGVYF